MYVFALYVGMITPVRLRESRGDIEDRACVFAEKHPDTIYFFSDEEKL